MCFIKLTAASRILAELTARDKEKGKEEDTKGMCERGSKTGLM